MTDHDHDHEHPHDHDHDSVEEYSLVGLMRFARHTYGSAVRDALSEVDCDDLPRNGAYVLGRLATGGPSLRRVTTSLRVSRQAVSQLLDTLVLRGFIERAVDGEDRRRMVATLTERGDLAATTAWHAASEVDAALEARVGAEAVATTKRVLAELIAIGEPYRNRASAER
jgi:DNA-binding MarR family transcriptional regulator